MIHILQSYILKYTVLLDLGVYRVESYTRRSVTVSKTAVWKVVDKYKTKLGKWRGLILVNRCTL